MLSKSDPFPALHAALEETHSDASYFFDNSRRMGVDRVAVQLTLSGTAFFENAAGRRMVPTEHAMLFVHGEDSSYGFPDDGSEPYKLRFIAFSPGSARAPFDHLRESFGSVVRMPWNSRPAAVFTELFERFQGRSFSDRFQQAELINDLIISLIREQVSIRRETDPIEYGLHLMRDHFRSPINLKTLAERCGITREHFIRQFSQRFGEPPGQVLRRLRLEHARYMLQATEMPVEELALACGFASSHSFGRAFRQHFGQSPSDFRQHPG